MRIGSSIFLIAFGAILAFAVTDRINNVDLTMVGYILFAVGVLGLVVTLVMNGQNNNNGQGNPPSV